MRLFCILVALLVAGVGAATAEVMPPRPSLYFNDYAHVVSAATASDLNRQLEQFERDTSSQILVAVYPKMDSDSSIEDYTVRVAQSWGVGQQGRNNGAVLFVFVQDHKMYIQVGYGLEGALPDALAKRIIDYEISPHFRAGDIDGGLRAGISAILAATKGEYKGTGQTVADRFGRRHRDIPWPLVIFAAIFIIGVVSRLLSSGTDGTVYSSTGQMVTYGLLNAFLSSSGRGYPSGGGSFGGGGSSGGGFSGGGGSFGGGGAGGSW